MPPALAIALAVGLVAQEGATSPSTAAADALAARGDLQAAASAYQQLVDAARGAPPPIVMYRLADVERRLGRNEPSLGHALDAATRFERAGDAARASEAWNLAGMAATNLGRLDDAAARFAQAMTLSATAGDWSRHSEQQVNAGTVQFLQGRYDEAARAFDAAKALASAHAAEPWATARTTLALANEAALWQRVGRYGDALAIYQQLLGDASSLPIGQQAQLLVNQGALFRRLGDPYKALAAYAEARRRFVAAGDAGSASAAATNRGIALALDLGRAGEAIAAFDEAMTDATGTGLRREALLARLYRGETRRRAGDLIDARDDFVAALAEATDLGAREEQWKAQFGLGQIGAAERRRDEARAAFDASLTIIEGLRERLGVPSTRAEFFQDKREVYDARIAAGFGNDTPATTFALVDASRARAWRDRAALSAVTLPAVQARLDVGTALLAYWVSVNGAAVVRVTRDSATVHRLAIDGNDIAAFDAHLRTADDPAWHDIAVRLGRTLLPPDVRGDARRLVIVPDGPLGAVPFDALVVDGRLVGEDIATSVLPTASALPLPTGPAGWRPPWTPVLAAFGDPHGGEDRWSGTEPVPPLPATAAEVRAIAATLGGRHRIFLGADDTVPALRAALVSPPPVLHLATHADADLASGERSRMLFSPTPDGAPASLFLREVYGLPLSGVDLAVLSACETERGPEVRGEGVQGFSRALLAAGARRAVTTLWRVPDAATARLMVTFYQRVQAGAPLDRALADAKRALRATPAFAHPHYWAAFVLTGPTDPLPRTVRWRDVGGTAAVAGALLLAAMAWRRRSSAARA